MMFGTIGFASADELDTIKEKGVMCIAMTGQYPPFNFVNESKKVVDFVDPYYRMNRAIFIKQGADVAALKGRKIGVTLGETHEKWARTQDGWEYKGLPELLLELDNGRIDAIVSDDIPVLLTIQENGIAVSALDTSSLSGAADSAGIAIRQGNPKLLAAIRGEGVMVAVEFSEPQSKSPDFNFTARVRDEAFKRKLILLTYGKYGNVMRFFAPLTIEDEIFTEALDIIVASIAAAQKSPL